METTDDIRKNKIEKMRMGSAELSSAAHGGKGCLDGVWHDGSALQEGPRACCGDLR